MDRHLGVSSKNNGFLPPNHPFVHRVFHYFHHPFWGTPIFGNTHFYSEPSYAKNDIDAEALSEIQERKRANNPANHHKRPRFGSTVCDFSVHVVPLTASICVAPSILILSKCDISLRGGYNHSASGILRPLLVTFCLHPPKFNGWKMSQWCFPKESPVGKLIFRCKMLNFRLGELRSSSTSKYRGSFFIDQGELLKHLFRRKGQRECQQIKGIPYKEQVNETCQRPHEQWSKPTFSLSFGAACWEVATWVHSDQNPCDILLYWLVYSDPHIGFW